jgi:hypothetical protein
MRQRCAGAPPLAGPDHPADVPAPHPVPRPGDPPVSFQTVPTAVLHALQERRKFTWLPTVDPRLVDVLERRYAARSGKDRRQASAPIEKTGEIA